jgi:SAM-dependent methyltransferase
LPDHAPPEFTGERLIPGHADPDLYNEHFARYAFAARLARRKRILDVGCGLGYGSQELARAASRVVAIDLAPEAVRAAAFGYSAPNLHYAAASATALPFSDAAFDLITAFEVIEHLRDWPALLGEARRLLAPGGQFIVSTPNRDYYAEARGESGPNPFHVHEFDYAEFQDALSAVFPSVTLFLQNHAAAIAFQPAVPPAASAAETLLARKSPAPETSHFFVAVCALSPQTGAPTYVFLPEAGNVLREREHHIGKLEAELALKNQWLDEKAAEYARYVGIHEKELKEAQQWARDLDSELGHSRDRVVELQNEIEDVQLQALDTVRQYEAKISELETELNSRNSAYEIRASELEAETAAVHEELAKSVGLLDAAEARADERTRWALSLQEQVNQLEARLAAVQASRWIRLGRRIGLGPDLTS